MVEVILEFIFVLLAEETSKEISAGNIFNVRQFKITAVCIKESRWPISERVDRMRRKSADRGFKDASVYFCLGYVAQCLSLFIKNL